MTPTRILQVFASLDRGGAETMIMNIYRKIDRNKVQFDFIVNENNCEYAFESEVKKLGGRIYRVPRFNIYNLISYRKTLKNLLIKHPEWGIIHGHHTSPALIYLQVAKKLKRVTIVHSHTAGGEIKVKSITKYAIRFPIRYISNYLFACSELAAKWMFGKHGKSAHIMNNAIDANSFIFNEVIREKIRRELEIENKFVIGHVGRFDSAKNQRFLVDVFKEIFYRNKNAIAIMIGDGKDRPYIEKKVKDLGLSNCVFFTGIRSDIPELLQAIDVFLFPSLYEGLPVTLVEAQASGLKCIVSDAITDEVKITDLVEFISLDKSPEYWAEQVLKYADGYERIDTSNKISEAGYDVKENAKWLQDFYLREYQKLIRD